MKYTPDQKAAAVAAVLGGESLNSVSQRMGIPRPSITRWCAGVSPDRSAIAQQKKAAIGEQVYDLLEDYIETLRVQVCVTRDAEWIKKQSASELAIFHGVLSDKSVRLLAAFRPGGDGRDRGDE